MGVSSSSTPCATSRSVLLIEGPRTYKVLTDDQPSAVDNEVLVLSVNKKLPRGTYAKLCQITTHEEAVHQLAGNSDS